MAIESITKILGSGSGIDIGSLVSSLVDAQFAVKAQELARREQALTAQISGVSQLRSAITNFDTALKGLVTGGTLSVQPVSADPASIKVSALSAGNVAKTNTAVGVVQLASAQASTYNTGMVTTQAFRGGTLTFQFDSDKSGGFNGGDRTATVDIATNDTLDTVVQKINAAGMGVTASTVTDGDKVRLVLKGGMGADQAFRVTGQDSGGGGGGRQSLTTLNLDPATTTNFTSGVRAQDAIVTLDGARYTRTSNTITDLLPGLKLELLKVTTAPVGITADRPTTALKEGVTNFVDAYNEILSIVQDQNDPKGGALRFDSATETLNRELARLTTTVLIPAGKPGAPRTLADLGVATQRDGTLKVDSARLTKVLTDFPEAVDAIFAPAKAGSPDGLSAALSKIATRIAPEATKKEGLNVSADLYAKQMRAVEDARTRATDQAEQMRARLTQQFASMDSRVAAYKSTMTFMENQVKAWNRSDS